MVRSHAQHLEALLAEQRLIAAQKPNLQLCWKFLEEEIARVKAAEKAHFQAQWWHQRRPDAKQTQALTKVMREAATAEVQQAQDRLSLGDKAGRNSARLAAYAAAVRAAVRAPPPGHLHQPNARLDARAQRAHRRA